MNAGYYYDVSEAQEIEATRIAIFVLLLAYSVAVKLPVAAAAGDPDAATGLIADKCTSCHEVPGYKARFDRAHLGAPTFETIAKTPGVYTPARLRMFLQKPHWPMTQFVLSLSDIDNILAFIERLRRSYTSGKNTGLPGALDTRRSLNSDISRAGGPSTGSTSETDSRSRGKARERP